MNKGMHRKRTMASTVISGTDGPASVFIAGKNEDRNIIRKLRTNIRRKRYQRKRAGLAAKLVPDAHTLPELCDYIKEKYRAKEIDASDIHYREQFPFEYHQYRIPFEGCGALDIVMDLTHEYLGYSYSASAKKGKKAMDGIVKDIYLYYGVTKEDMEQNSERMQSLLTVLASID